MTRMMLAAVLLLLGSVATAAQDESEVMWRLAQEGRIDEALAMAEVCVADHPEDAMAHHNLGRFLFMAGEHELAVEALITCLEIGPPAAWARAWSHNILGQALARLGEKERAVKHLRTAVEMDATANCTRDASAALLKLTGVDPWGKGPLVGAPLPEFAFHGLAGEAYRNEDFAGTAVLLRFGASW